MIKLFTTLVKILKTQNMIKKLLTISAIALSTIAVAQTGKIVTSTTQYGYVDVTAAAKANSTPTTVLISPFSGTSTSIGLNTAGSDTATPGCSPKAGYVVGSNCYDDQEKAQYFPASSYSNAVSNASITGAVVYLYRNAALNYGVSSSTNNAMTALNIYAGTSNATAPGALMGSKSESVSTIVTAAGTSTAVFTYTFVFSTPISVNAGFYASVVTPTTAGDTMVVYAQSGTLAAVNNAWERWSDNSWNGMNPAWGSTFKANLAIFPIISGSVSSVGMTKATSLNKNVSVMPNPTNGDVFVNLALTEASNVSINVTNTLGQVIEAREIKNAQFENVSIDLSKFDNGIYFVTVSNGKDKMVKRIVLNK